MGISLTNAAKQELAGASQTQYVNAQTSLSKGIISQRGGNTIESLAYFYEAKNYDPSFNEAVARVNTLSATISTGGMGDKIRNDIAWRDEWLKLLTEAHSYFMNNQPTPFVELVYDPTLIERSVNFQERTARLSFYATLYTVRPPSFQILSDLKQGLEATKRNRAWELNFYPHRWIPNRLYRLSAELVNDRGETVSTMNDSVGESYLSVTDISRQEGRTDLDFGVHEWWYCGMNDDFVMEFHDNSNRVTYSTKTSSTREISFTVKASDITEGMTIRIRSVVEYEYVNEKYGCYRLNRYGPNIISISTGKLSGEPPDPHTRLNLQVR
jgi:hypothetical protein